MLVCIEKKASRAPKLDFYFEDPELKIESFFCASLQYCGFLLNQEKQ